MGKESRKRRLSRPMKNAHRRRRRAGRGRTDGARRRERGTTGGGFPIPRAGGQAASGSAASRRSAAAIQRASARSSPAIASAYFPCQISSSPRRASS